MTKSLLVSPIFGAVVAALLVTSLPQEAWSVRPDDDTSTLAVDDPYALGLEAFDNEDWADVIYHMTDVINEKPWHDNAHSLLGFAHRKLGDFERSLAFYDKALTLNPHNREALEYLGEAYLDMNQPERTEEVLERLALECERIASSFPNGDWQAGCEEWIHLNAAYQAHGGDAPRR